MKHRTSKRGWLGRGLSTVGCLMLMMMMSCAACDNLRPVHPQLPTNPSFQNVVNIQQPLAASKSVIMMTPRGARAMGAATMLRCEAGQKAYALTAAHLVTGYYKYFPKIFPMFLSDHRQGHKFSLQTFKVLRVDTKKDLALLVSVRKQKEKCTTVSLSDVDPLLGSRVWAIGAPVGYVKHITSGVLSSVAKQNSVNIYRSDVAISPGSSGGGLFNDQGKLIGVVVGQLQKGTNIITGTLYRSVPGFSTIVALKSVKEFLGNSYE